jgi:type IV pilus assembly protein PilZ
VERREHPRAPIELKVDYRKLNSFFADYTKNISKGGTFIKTSKPLPEGTRFLFHLVVPGRAVPFELSGVVARVSGEALEGEEAGMGIRFVWTDDDQRREFEAAVERMMEESLGPELARKLLGEGR